MSSIPPRIGINTINAEDAESAEFDVFYSASSALKMSGWVGSIPAPPNSLDPAVSHSGIGKNSAWWGQERIVSHRAILPLHGSNPRSPQPKNFPLIFSLRPCAMARQARINSRMKTSSSFFCIRVTREISCAGHGHSCFWPSLPSNPSRDKCLFRAHLVSSSHLSPRAGIRTSEPSGLTSESSRFIPTAKKDAIN